MKHLIAIFSVIFVFGIMNETHAAKNCKPVSCDSDSDAKDAINVNVGKGIGTGDGLCFYCENGYAGNSQCADQHIIGRKNPAGLVTGIYSCKDAAKDEWIYTSVTAICSGSDLSLTTIEEDSMKNYTCSYSLDGSTYDYSSVNGASTTDGIDKVCVMCKCKVGYKANSAKTDCVLDTTAQETCNNSHGDWVSDKCTCDGTKGLIDDDPGKTCKCKDETPSWDGSQCVDPDAAAKKKCSDSGGNWDGGTCKCDSGKGLGGPNGDGECYCSDSGTKYSRVEDKCVLTEQAVCENSGGTWNGASETCTCDKRKNVKGVSGSDPMRCTCINEDYKPDDPPSKGCKLTAEAENRIKAFDEMKENCVTNWKGTWKPDKTSEAARDRSNWKCECMEADGKKQTEDKLSCTCDGSLGYVLDSVTPPYNCRLSDYDKDKKNCDDASAAGADVTWVDNGFIDGRRVGECKCNSKNQAYNYATKTCLNTAVWCTTVPGAKLTSKGTCLCLSTGLPPVNYKCPTAGGTASGSSSPIAADKLTAATKRKTEITDISKKLTEISDSFGRSHWKTASGNFNGARLASDSIAGVVLGTVGGVVTSNIIKKNQVKGGFENIGCTVGGQIVADYGDQFQVGVR